VTGTTRTRVRKTRGGVASFLTFVLTIAAALALTGTAAAETGVPCAPTGMESVSTPRDHYQAGEVATISGGGYAIGCDVRVEVERPDGVVESFTAATDFGGNFTLDYQVPPPPGLVGQYTVVVRGLDGAVLATTTFEDAPAPQFDIAPSHVATTGTRVFTAVVRNTANAAADTARCIRVTTPASVTVTGATFTVASPGTTGPWTLTTGPNFVQVRTSGAGIFGAATSSNNWVRFEITANATVAGTNTWTARMTSTNADCASGGSSDQLGVSVAQALPRQYTADFRDAANAVIAAPTVVEDTSQAYRIRITRTAGSDDLQHIVVALPTCFTSITGISTTDSGAPAYTAELTDNMFRLIPNTKLAANGEWVQVHFAATADCPTGAHEFRTASWKNTSPETGQGDIFQLSPGTFHPTLTVLSGNVAPTVAATNATVTVNEGQTATNTGVWGDANLTDTVTLSASVGTVTKSGTNGAGTWSWSYPTTDGPDQTQMVTITAHDGTTSTSTTFQLNVNNVAPTVELTGADSANEGATNTYTYTVFDPGQDTPTVTESCMNATYVDTAAANSFGCTFPDGPASSIVSVTADDGDPSNNIGSDEIDVSVANVAPTATFNAPFAVDEGDDITISLTDPQDVDADLIGLQYAFDCDGDGAYGPWSSVSSATCSTVDDESRTVKGKIKDKDGGESEYTQVVLVQNVDATATISGAPETSPEGTQISLTGSFTDPGSADTHTQEWSVTKNGVAFGGGGSGASFSFTPDDNGTYVVTYTVTDDDGGVGTDSKTVEVSNVDPTATISGAPETSPEGTPISLTGSFTDPGSADTHTREWSVSKNGGAYASGSGGSFGFTPDDNGTYVVTFTVTDDDGGAGSDSKTITVTNVAPSTSINGAPATSPEGTEIDLTSSVQDPGSADTHTYAWSVTKDGSPYASGTDENFSFTPDDNGSYVVTLTVTDDDGGTDTGTATITVNNVAPAASIDDAPETSAEGTEIDLTNTVTDPGSADTHTYAWSVTKDGAPFAAGTDDDFAFTPDDNGSYVVTLTVTDDDGGVGTDSKTIDVTNVAPSATFANNGPVNEGSPIVLELNGTTDPSSVDTAAGFQYRFDCGDGSGYGASGPSNNASCPTTDNGVRTVKGEVRDKDGGTREYTAEVTVNNVAPSATIAGAPATSPEGTPISVTGSFTDPGSADTHTQAWSVTKDGNPYGSGGSGASFSFTPDDNGTYVVTYTVTDDDGGVGSDSKTITVTNVAPTLHSLEPSSYLVQKGNSVSVTGKYIDPGSADTFTCVITWDDGSPTQEVAGGPTSCTASHTFAAQGTYSVSMKVRDDDGGESNTLTIIITVYDPSAGGFVTGGGWIMSPAGSYAADPTASGKANFGFNSQYKKGSNVPTGQTEFQLHFASFNFHSETYEALVVSGYKAQYRGTGTVNGATGYKFILTAYDGQITGGGGVDKFRIKIWRISDGVVVYDTKMGTSDDMDLADPLAIGGGSVVIHKPK
jgi:PKD repeat protein